MLTYTRTTTTTETRQVAVTARKNWGCYNSSGNYAMKRRAESFLSKLEKLKADGAGIEQLEKAVAAFIRSYSRFTETKTGWDNGASDTEVRNTVFYWLVNVGSAIGLSESDIDRLWDRNYD